jgi:hypothetical protein
VFVVLKGQRRGLPLSATGLDEVLDGVRRRAGLARATCHQLRHHETAAAFKAVREVPRDGLEQIPETYRTSVAEFLAQADTFRRGRNDSAWRRRTPKDT